MPIDTNIKQLVINQLTQAQYNNATISDNELYVVTDGKQSISDIDGLSDALLRKVEKNNTITGATKCKITYDSKGLVTSGADLSASDIPDLSSTYQTLIDSTHKLSADLVDDTGTTNKFVTTTEKSTWSDKQDQLVSGTNIKTINSTSLLGSGDIEIVGLPSQTSQNNKYLTTNGTTASWADIPAVATFYWGE